MNVGIEDSMEIEAAPQLAEEEDVDYTPHCDIIPLKLWEQALKTPASLVDPLPSHLQSACAVAEGDVCMEVLASHAAGDPDLPQAWWHLVLF